MTVVKKTKTKKTALSAKDKKALAKTAKTADKAVSKSLDEMNMAELVKLFNEHSDAKVKKFKDKPTAVRRLTKLFKDKGIALPRKTKAAVKRVKTDGDRKPRTESKAEKIRELFRKKNSAHLEEIMEYCGHDLRNTQSMMCILNNPRRTKDEMMVKTTYDRKTKVYTLIED